MRLIDADKLEEDLNNPEIFNVFPIVFRIIQEQETICNLENGKWIFNADNFTPAHRCSVCGYNRPMISGGNKSQDPMNFCNNCGAKMDGDVSETD